MTIFSSDNVTIACPEIMDALVKANSGNVDSYGDDKWSESLKRKMSDLFEKDVEYIVFGPESVGLPEEILKNYKDKQITIPMDTQSRSINLANAVGIVMYEYLRQNSINK